MTPSEKYIKKLGLKDQDATEVPDVTNKKEVNENSRRSFFKKLNTRPKTITKQIK